MFDRTSAAWQVVEPQEWPYPPRVMTFSSLVAIESCPRRCALETAQYPGVWQKGGYPSRFNLMAFEGTVVHAALEKIIQALSSAGVESARYSAAPTVLRELGGFSEILENEALRLLAEYEGNPRVESALGDLGRNVRSSLGRMRERTQGILAQVQLRPQARIGPGDRVDPLKESALGLGSHPEVRFAANGLGWVGVADLINLSPDECEIVDFKTGEPKPEHILQIRIYSLLWLLDSTLNPDSRPVDRLSISYPTRTVEVEPLDNDGIQELTDDLMTRTEQSHADLGANPPPARPSPENCRYCGVRQLCREYWSESTQKNIASDESDGSYLVDVEATVISQHGATSWDTTVDISSRIPKGAELLVRTSPGEVSLRPGDRIRLLSVYATEDLNGGSARPIVTSCAGTEIFFVPKRGDE